jgi:proline iminopeptidase
VILVPGGPGCTRLVFGPWFDFLLADYSLVDYDPVGCGDSPSANGQFSLDVLVEELALLIAACGEERAIVIGHSFGGVVAQLFALRHPALVRALVLVCSGTGLPEIEAARRRFGQAAGPRTRGRIERRLERLAARHPEKVGDPFVRKLRWGLWRCYYRRRPPAWWFRAMPGHFRCEPGYPSAIEADARGLDLAGRFAECPFPCLVADSTHDLVWAGGKAAALVANHPRATVALFRWSGHSPFVDEPRRFRRVLLVWLRSLSGA